MLKSFIKAHTMTLFSIIRAADGFSDTNPSLRKCTLQKRKGEFINNSHCKHDQRQCFCTWESYDILELARRV